MKRILFAVMAATLIPATAMAGTVYTRAWCKHPAHGRNDRGGYGWISHTFSGSTSDECWRFAKEHSGLGSGHQTGCSYVKADGTY